MGILLRWILLAFGVPFDRRTNITSLSKSVECLRHLGVGKSWRWLAGGTLHLLPVIAVFVLLVYYRAEASDLYGARFIALAVAASWAFVGPALAWKYERYTIPRFLSNCRSLFKHHEDFAALRRLGISSLFSRRSSWVILFGWYCLVGFGYYRSIWYLPTFGVNGAADPFFWLFLIGLCLFTFYTSLGFCFAYRTFQFARLIANSRLNIKPFASDGNMGFAFVGDFIFKTSGIFFSGWLFAPLVIFVGIDSAGEDYVVPELLLGTYFVFILFSFIAPLAIVRTKLVEHKRTLAKEYSAAANSANARLKKRWLRDDGDAVKHYAELLQALRTSNSWPIRGSVAARFSVSSIAFPLLSALISAISKGYLGK